MAFKTHLLPESYDILDHVSINKTQRGSGAVRGNAHSTNGSAASSTSGTRKCLQAQEQTHDNTRNTDAGKNLFWPGATPTFGARITPKSLRASEVAPGHRVCALHTNFPLSCVRSAEGSCPSGSTVLTCTTPSTEEYSPCLY